MLFSRHLALLGCRLADGQQDSHGNIFRKWCALSLYVCSVPFLLRADVTDYVCFSAGSILVKGHMFPATSTHFVSLGYLTL